MDDITFKFNVVLERLWPLLRDMRLILKFSGHYQELTNLNQLQKWKSGNVLQGDIFECELFRIKCLKLKSYSQYKKIKWQFQDSLSSHTSQIVIELFADTNIDETIAYWKIKFDNKSSLNNTNIINEYKYSVWNMFNKIKSILVTSNLNLYQFEGCVISGNVQVLKELLKNPFKMKIIAPLWCSDVSLEEDNFDLQQIEQYANNKVKFCSKDYIIVKVTLEGMNIVKYIILNCKCFNTKSRNKVYRFYCMDNKKDIIYIGTANLFQIDKDECFFGLLHEFRYPTSNTILRDLSMKKKYIMTSLKNYIENFA